MLHALQKAESPAKTGDTSHRRSAPRLRALFLRRFRECGEVRQAAALAGIARSTLYRWREKDDRFRARWETYDEMKRHDAEERLSQLVREGEKVAAFYKGQQVGWKVSFTARPAAALLASQDRREKMRLMELARAEKRASVSHSDGRFQAKSHAASKAWADTPPRKTSSADDTKIAVPAETRPSPPTSAPEPLRPADNAVSVSRSGERPSAENRVASKGWSTAGARKKLPSPPVPHRLQDNWRLPREVRRPDGLFEQAFPIRHPNLVIPSTALLRRPVLAGAAV